VRAARRDAPGMTIIESDAIEGYLRAP
jgi:hypothetical protein